MLNVSAAALRASLGDAAPPPHLRDELVALWHDGRGDWARAHEAVQDVETPAAAWVHAYLHRKEGDLGNARYWYARAGQPACATSLDAEWEAIVSALGDTASAS
ncbi:MAG: hypothetical protein H0V80_09640 [Acidobacteria bacterium]|nr:hypothetical protein [Acidobacteriota bacterium]